MGTVKKMFKDLYGRFVKRKAQEFNVENRAHKFLDQTKLPNAPGHQNEGKILEKMLKANPHLKEEVDKKHEKLVDNMGQVDIKVTYPPEMKASRKKYPKDRTIIPKNTNFKVDNVPAGCIDFEIFLKIFDYKYNHLWTNEEIAEEFDLDEKNVEDLLFFFKPFNNKVVDKKRYLAAQDSQQDKSYVKIAELLNRDVETFKVIPDYKKELARIEEENKKNQIEETTKEDEIYEETEEEYLERVKSQEFMNERFFIAGQTDKDVNDEVESDKPGKDDAKQSSKDDAKKGPGNDKNEEAKKSEEIKNEAIKNEAIKNEAIKNEEAKKSEEIKKSDAKKETNGKRKNAGTETDLKEDSKKKNGSKSKDKKDVSKDLEKKPKSKKKSKKSSKNSQNKDDLENNVKDNSK